MALTLLAVPHISSLERKGDAVERARDKMDAAFEFITKLNVPFYCFHDVDVVDYTNDVADNERRLQALVDYAKQKQQQSGVKLLWGTANVFSHQRYMNGASTNPDFHVLAHAAAQVKAAWMPLLRSEERTMCSGEEGKAT